MTLLVCKRSYEAICRITDIVVKLIRKYADCTRHSDVKHLKPISIGRPFNVL